MKELSEYRRNLIEKLAGAARDFRAACLAITDAYAPWGAGEWNAHQVAVHTRDIDKLVYGLRSRRTAEEENPEFRSFDGDEYMAEHYDAGESLDGLLNGFVENVEALTNILRALPDEAWARESRHATLGSGFTLQTWVERNLAHIEEHMEIMKKANSL
ncbi:MAG: DinB family protein [Anaerolineales bacterium]